jgi:hypothetical protein
MPSASFHRLVASITPHAEQFGPMIRRSLPTIRAHSAQAKRSEVGDFLRAEIADTLERKFAATPAQVEKVVERFGARDLPTRAAEQLLQRVFCTLWILDANDLRTEFLTAADRL